MTIQEAVRAARANDPVVYEDPMLGDMLFARICEINKVFRKKSDVERGKEPEQYYLTLESMRSRVGSMHTCQPEDVRIATAQDIVDSGIHREDVVPDAVAGYDRLMGGTAEAREE